MITSMMTGFDAAGAEAALTKRLTAEVIELTKLVLNSARGNIRYYPEVASHLQEQLFVLAGQSINGVVSSSFWQAWLEQFGKGSLMAGPDQNPGLIRYMSSGEWNNLRDRSSRAIVGRIKGTYRGIDGVERKSGGGRAGVNLEELAAQGEIDPAYRPTPPTFFLRIALQSNRGRILASLQRVIENFPYHAYFREGKP